MVLLALSRSRDGRSLGAAAHAAAAGADDQVGAALPAAGGAADLVPDGRAHVAQPVGLLGRDLYDLHPADAAPALRLLPPAAAERYLPPGHQRVLRLDEIGRASCRERVCKYV